MRTIYIILFTTFLFLKTFSQDNQSFNINNERLFVHVDRSEYVAGERIWFKIIAYQKEETKVPKTSKLVYIEIINPQGLAIARKKVRMNGVSGFGEFQLPDTITTGVYRVLAYTNWMKNLGYSSFFKSNILVYNPQKSGQFKKAEVLIDFDISTENNELISELNNTIYYKLNSEIFDSCSIVIKDSEKNILKSKNIENAYGYISFIPKKDIKYVVSLISNNSNIEKELPNTKAEGVIINLKEVNAENVKFQVQSTELYQSLVKEIFYSINCSEELTKLELDANSTVTINNSFLKNGKNKITFYKNDQSLISERYFYYESENKQIIEFVGLENESIRKRMLAKAKIELIKSNDFNNVNLSITIHKIPKSTNATNEFYFDDFELNRNKTNINNKNIAQLFEQINTDAQINNNFYPEYRGALLTGKIITQEGKPLAENDIFLSFPDSVIRLTITKTSEKGEFIFYINSDEKGRDIVINSNNNNKNLTILIDDNFYNNYPTQKIALNNVHEDYLNDLFINYRIKKLYEIENSKKEDSIPVNIKYSFYEQADDVYNLDDYVKLDSIHEYFYEIVQGVRVTKNNKNWIARVVDAGTGVSYNNDPALFIDGVYFENIKSLLRLDPSECSAIEVIRKPIMLKNRNYDGLIAIFTKDYNLNGIDLPSNSTRIEYKISDKSFEFWSKPTIKKEMPDFRNTLYWNPEIVLEKGKATEIEFYTGDDSSWYEIEIRGITDTGIEVSEHKIFKVGNP